MKFIKSKCIQKSERKKVGKYEITLLVTDHDINMFEDLVHSYEPFEVLLQPTKNNNFNAKYSPDYNDKYRKWLNSVWKCFLELWSKYD